jgi:trimethylamine--corrinoid protein Co-methyltransferase
VITTTRPKIELLSPEFMAKIVDEAYGMLERHGVFVENAEALDLLAGAGARVDASSQRVRMDRRLVEDCLASTPPEVNLYDRAGEKSFRIGGDEVHFDPGSAAVVLFDYEAGAERKPVTRDLVDFCRLVETLEHLHFQSTGLVSVDVPEAVADCYRLYLGLRLSTKPIVTGLFRVESFGPMKDLLVAVRGSEAALAEKPLAIFDACPSPPLKWSRLTSQSLIDAARAGIPSELISMGMTGATSLATLAGTLVQHVAENAAGIVIGQTARRGAPIIFGGSPMAFDMRKGTTPMGAVETMMIDAAYAQIGKFLKLPTHAYMGLSDAKILDAQAGSETAMGAVLAALAGVNVVSGPGMLDFERCQSLEKLAIDNEICGMAYRLLAGIALREDPIALDKFEGFGPGFQFLSHPHTRKWHRQEHFLTTLADRDPYESWVNAGRRSIGDRAREDVARRLARYTLPPLPEGRAGDLERTMAAYAKTEGMAALPGTGL